MRAFPRVLLVFVACAAAGWARASAPPAAPAPRSISLTEIERETDAGPIRGFVAEVALDHPAVDVVVTAPLEDPPAEHVEALLEPTDAWAERVGATLAVNANFFAWLDGGARWSDVIGLSVSDREVASPRRVFEGRADASLVFDAEGRAAILRPGEGRPTEIVDAVSGVAGSVNKPGRGGLLVRGGRNTGATARVAPEARHPRTAVGVRDEGRTLVIVTVDGRQPGWSVGVTLPELADLMLERGVVRAINLDGGGSTSLVYRDAETGELIATNRPSDGRFRPVANHLGIRLLPVASGSSAPTPDAGSSTAAGPERSGVSGRRR